MTMAKWQPGKTLIGLPDRNNGTGSYLINHMDQFFALAKSSARIADDAIRNAMVGITTTVCVNLPPQHANCKSVSLPFKVLANCRDCGNEGSYLVSPNGIYVCKTCRAGETP